jgi:hypothetical protein
LTGTGVVGKKIFEKFFTEFKNTGFGNTGKEVLRVKMEIFRGIHTAFDRMLSGVLYQR